MDKLLVARELRQVAKSIVMADEEWTKTEWQTYKKEHPATELHPKIKKEGPSQKEDEGGDTKNPKKDEPPTLMQRHEQKQEIQKKVEHFQNLKQQTQDELEKVMKFPGKPKQEPEKLEQDKQQPKPETQSTPEKVQDDKPSNKYHVKPLFPNVDASLPKDAVQPIDTKDELYAQAEEANKQLLDILDNGNDFQKSLDMKHFPPGSINLDDRADLSKLNGQGMCLITAPLKGQKRAIQKVESDFGGHWNRLTDVVRCSIAVDNYSDLDKFVEKLGKSGIKLANQPTDRFTHPTDAGYRDVKLNMTMPNGHVGELQLHVKPMLAAKADAHHQYEGMRDIWAQMSKEGRKDMTLKEQHDYSILKKQSLQIYNKAWDEANAGNKEMKTSSSKRHRLTAREKEEAIVYYNYDGFPAYRKRGQVPMMTVVGGKTKAVYDGFKFDHTAVRIEESEYKKLLHDMK